MADYLLSSYSVTIGRVKMPGMGSDPASWCAAGIRCRQPTSGPFLDICFMPAGVALPANTSSGNWHISYRPLAEFPYYLDLLRNEGPLHMELDGARPERHAISTANFESVGEGE